MGYWQGDPRAAENFDKHFTSIPLDLTPGDAAVLANLRGDEFRDFSFANPLFPN